MKLLAIESSSNACSVAFYDKDILLAHDFKAMVRGHSETLIPMIEDVVKRTNLSMDSLDAITVSIGPGALTGLRIGISSARALGLALNIPIYAITTSNIIAASLDDDQSGALLVVLETKRADLYVEYFPNINTDRYNPEGQGAQALSLEDACQMAGDITTKTQSSIYLAGDGAVRLTPLLIQKNIPYTLKGGDNLPTAVLLGHLAISEIERNPNQQPQPPEPLYIRPPDATLPSKPALILQGK